MSSDINTFRKYFDYLDSVKNSKYILETLDTLVDQPQPHQMCNLLSNLNLKIFKYSNNKYFISNKTENSNDDYYEIFVTDNLHNHYDVVVFKSITRSDDSSVVKCVFNNTCNLDTLVKKIQNLF
jgi:hypothetical protein